MAVLSKLAKLAASAPIQIASIDVKSRYNILCYPLKLCVDGMYLENFHAIVHSM
jgi:hypothetical protein